MSGLIPTLTANKKDWYLTEKNTSALIRSVAASRSPSNLSGDQIWSLITLTWITKTRKAGSPQRWKKYKIPALALLFKKSTPNVRDGLSATIDSMKLPKVVAQSAKEKTGMVNFRGTWRNSSREWCKTNRDDLTKIIRAAAHLSTNDQSRFDLAARIDKLPDVKSPRKKVPCSAGNLLTPLVACIDPRCRFPIVNGRKAVTSLLRKLHLAHSDLRQQVQGLVGIIGQKDAFMLDVMSAMIIEQAPILERLNTKTQPGITHESPLRNYDEEERKAVLASHTVTYRKRHNKMTAALDRIFSGLNPTTETSRAGRCDTIVKDYDGMSRDLLIEAKPDPDKGSMRIAIRQLFDYKRHRTRQAATDLVVLTITRPSRDYIDLLIDLGITAVWFGNESCKQITGGEGKAWTAIAECIAQGK